jgi:hypothetical protein
MLEVAHNTALFKGYIKGTSVQYRVEVGPRKNVGGELLLEATDGTKELR